MVAANITLPKHYFFLLNNGKVMFVDTVCFTIGVVFKCWSWDLKIFQPFGFNNFVLFYYL